MLSSVIMLDNLRSSDVLVDGRVLQKNSHQYFSSIYTISIVQALTYSQKNLQLISILSIYSDSDSFVVYLGSCHVFLAEFRASDLTNIFQNFS